MRSYNIIIFVDIGGTINIVTIITISIGMVDGILKGIDRLLLECVQISDLFIAFENPVIPRYKSVKRRLK